MDFLLECIGFPPGQDPLPLAQRILADGEPVAWRGPAGVHLRYPLSGGLEVRLDREQDEDHCTLWPHYRVDHRLRVAVREVRPVPDSPFDAFLLGTANPEVPSPGDAAPPPSAPSEEYLLATYVCDARRIPRALEPGHVLAVSVAGFALDVSYVGPNEGVRDPSILERPRGALFEVLGEDHDPGGCMDVSLRVREVRHLRNPLTGVPVEVIEADAPGRPIELFVSRWQLEADGVPTPRPGWRIEGAFLFTGRVTGGLPKPPARVRQHFG